MKQQLTTIAAISTAFQNAAIGVVRLSGADSLAIADAAFSPLSGRAFSTYTPRTAVTGNIKAADGSVLDLAVVLFYRAPHSYTGEDIVEFSCHGGTVVLSQVLARLVELGAMPAERGEYTMRAFLNGKMDLTQSEAVIDIITAKTPLSAKQAFLQSGGALRRKIEAARSILLDIDASVMVYVDYSSEGMEEPQAGELLPQLTKVHASLASLIQSYDTGRLIKDGVDAVICGRPNVGKSSVMNLLCGEEKSIVTELAGTTRDVVESAVNIGGLRINLGDTAGVRETSHIVEQIGVTRARERAEQAELLLCVFDASQPMQEDDYSILSLAEGKNAVAIINKSDLTNNIELQVLQSTFSRCIAVSAVNGTGLEELKLAIYESAASSPIDPDGLYVTNLRQLAALREADAAVCRGMEAMTSGIPAEIAETDIRDALTRLGEITGDTVTEDLIERIFENFCVGK